MYLFACNTKCIVKLCPAILYSYMYEISHMSIVEQMQNFLSVSTVRWTEYKVMSQRKAGKFGKLMHSKSKQISSKCPELYSWHSLVPKWKKKWPQMHSDTSKEKEGGEGERPCLPGMSIKKDSGTLCYLFERKLNKMQAFMTVKSIKRQHFHHQKYCFSAESRWKFKSESVWY